jgi:hypothetical protein
MLRMISFFAEDSRPTSTLSATGFSIEPFSISARKEENFGDIFLTFYNTFALAS